MKYIFRVLFVVVICILPLSDQVYAQISQPATPPSFAFHNLKTTIPVIKMPELDLKHLQTEDQVMDTIKEIPWRFGKNIPVDIDFKKEATVIEKENGDRIYLLSLSSQGAYSINLTFNHYRLPAGGQLFIYNSDRTQLIGAFTDFNNQDDLYFATTLVGGDFVTLEYFEPANVEFPGILTLETVTHAYRDPFQYAKVFGQSGDCNLNIACSEAEGWERQIRSVGMLVSNGNGFCSGVLINNTEFNEHPYFLSANHCYSNPSTLVFWFNWESEECENPSSSPSYDAISGAVSIARNSGSDFWLLEFMHNIPDSYNPYYAGWNRTLEHGLHETITGIHHPSGDIKKFSYALDGVQTSRYAGNPGTGTTHWRIVWSGGTTTEGGSSGSPIFDQRGRIIGQLHGGGAACGNTLPDWYGKFGVSWTGGESPATRLSDWLDPTATGAMAIQGLDPFEKTIAPPLNFSAKAEDKNSILLQWELNEVDDYVVIAGNTTDNFGAPSGTISLGQTLEDGGEIIYIGKATHFKHYQLNPGTKYYYNIWSWSYPGSFYSEASEAKAGTYCETITAFPFTEVFNEEHISDCWQQEYITHQVSWQTAIGNNAGYPAQAQEGERNALMRINDPQLEGSTTRLISTALDISTYHNASVSFYYANPSHFGRQDILRVYYRSAMDSPWSLLKTFDTDQPDWTQVTLDFPEKTSQTFIAFEGEANRGRGISLDNIIISVAYEFDFPEPSNLVATVNHDDNVELTWEMGSKGEKDVNSTTGINIYRDDELIYKGEDINQTSYTDFQLPLATYSYLLKTRYPDGSTSAASNTASATIAASENDLSLSLSSSSGGNTSPKEGSYTYRSGTSLAIFAYPDTGYELNRWEVNGALSGSTHELHFLLQEDLIAEAIFSPKDYEINLQSHPSNAAETLEGHGVFSYSNTAVLSATPKTGYIFKYWKSGEKILSQQPQYEHSVTEHLTITAVFESRSFKLQAAPYPTYAGSIIGAGDYPAGTEVTLSAIPNNGWNFRNWTLRSATSQIIMHETEDYTLLLNDDLELRANFDPVIYLLTIETEGSGTTTPLAGEHEYERGSIVTLDAQPEENWNFLRWEVNDEKINSQRINLTINGNTRALVIFEDATSISPLARNESISILPVPAKNNIYITLPWEGAWQLQLISLTGSVVLNRHITDLAENSYRLNVSRTQSGVYILRASHEKGVFNSKIIIE